MLATLPSPSQLPSHVVPTEHHDSVSHHQNKLTVYTLVEVGCIAFRYAQLSLRFIRDIRYNHGIK